MTCILHANNICMHHGYSCWQAKVAKLEENPDAYDEESEEESQESDNSSDDPEINTAEIVGKEIPTSSKPVGKDIPTDSSSSDKGVGKDISPASSVPDNGVKVSFQQSSVKHVGVQWLHSCIRCQLRQG